MNEMFLYKIPEHDLMFSKTMATIVLISIISMIMTVAITQQASAAPKIDKQTTHEKSTFDPDTGEQHSKGGYNQNGPSGHNNCKYTYDYPPGDYQLECK
jgi:hypothetical protein